MKPMRRSVILGGFVLAVLVLALQAAAKPAPPPVIAWTPTTGTGAYDYGAVDPGLTLSQVFTLTNADRVATGALKVVLTGTAFTKTAYSCTAVSIGPAKSCTVTVSFAPTTAGASYAGTLVATAKKSAATLALAGAGTASGPRHIYWANYGRGTISRADVDGTNVLDDIITGIGVWQVRGVAVNANYIYWVTDSGRIGRANLDGTDVRQDIITAAPAWGVAVDDTYVYWAEGGSAVGRAKLDGTDVDTTFITGACGPYGVAVNANHLYWVNHCTNTIARAKLDGTEVNLSLVSVTADPDLRGLALDDAHIYWANSGANNKIGRADLDGTDPEPDFLTGSIAIFLTGLAVDPGSVDPSYIYWSNFPGSISRAKTDGTAVELPFIDNRADAPQGVAVDAG